jgi:Zn-dependent protease
VAVLFYLIAIIAVILCIITHEMAHKFTARGYGCWAEFRRNDFGLAIGIFTALVGFGFIVLPGATYHKGYLTDAQNGKVSAAGPFTNAVIGYLFLPLALLLGNVPIVGYILVYVVIVSALLGVFNMLPFGPLDGRKVWHWNPGIYLLLMVALIGLVVIAEYNFHFMGIL